MSNFKVECAIKHAHAVFDKETKANVPFFFRIEGKVELLQKVEGKGAGLLKGSTILVEGEDFHMLQAESIAKAKEIISKLPELASVETKVINIDENVDNIKGERELRSVMVEALVKQHEKFGDNVGVVASAKVSAIGKTLEEAQNKAIELARKEIGI